MRTKEFIHDVGERALHLVGADQVEVGITSYEEGVTRVANSIIHQNLTKEVDEFWGRVILGKKIGGVSLTSIESERIKQGISTAYEFAKYQKEDTDFHSLPQATPVEYTEDIHPISPEERAQFVNEVVKVANAHHLIAAGVIYNIREIVGIFNSLGVRSIGELQHSTAQVTMLSDTSSGFAFAMDKEFHKINPTELAETASYKAILSKNPIELEPRKYTVLLEEYAVAELLMFLSWIGFGAREYEEGSSFMSGKIGKKITGNNITIIDDVSFSGMTGLPFDYEGVPKQKVTMIKDGIASAVVYDSYYGHKNGVNSTGHALPQPNPWGPYPSNIVLTAGTSTKEEMLSSIETGIWVTRFWYTRIVDPDKTLVTGMTRDGTFLIKNGKPVSGVKNLRFTVNILEALANTIKISNEYKLIEQSLVPALLIEDFNFTGKTEY